MDSQKTIAAIATPYGEGAIGIIRISGRDALAIANQIFSKDVLSFPSHTAHYGKILTRENEVMDYVLLLVMKAPKSYTGEDSVEIQCHGGSYITKSILQRVIEAGAYAATPGEFTKRAYLNGKIDLTQAEAVQTLIAAKNTFAVKAAKNQLEGSLSKMVASFQSTLFDIAAILEAWVDFPEEDLAFESFSSLIKKLEQLISKMSALSDTFEQGQKITDAISICLIGQPNVGKSSLMNTLLRKERAIVSEIAGTTRDTVEEEMIFNQMHLRLIDTAGIQNTNELIEKKGIERSLQAMETADIILFVLDAKIGLTTEEKKRLSSLNPDKTIVVINKIDLHTPPSIDFPNVTFISVKNNEGIDQLLNKIETLIETNRYPVEEIILTSLRHKQSLDQAIVCLKQVVDGLKTNVSAEFVSFDIRQSLTYLSEMIGKDVTEEILHSIFANFCLGK